ncbi:MAG: SufD family Fe-S cluster assembly protein, partial [Elusimicrobia bacterium]|nr:SufD family Fe-S cluster assembly protein [Elusimicrobiota bacterium]
VIADLGPSSRAAIIEESAVLSGSGTTWRNRTAVFRLAEDAQLDYCQIQAGGAGRIPTAGASGKEPVSKTFSASAGARTFETTAGLLRQARGSRFHSRALTFGGELVRNDFDGVIEGEGAECVMDGLYAVHGQEHVDNHTLIRHDAPHGTSRELYKGVLDGSAQAAFRGIVEVAPQAQKTDAMVYNKNLLLSEKGWVNTKPEFRIFANDVQCKHGSTIGRLPEDALFYLRSRGISEERSRAFLIRAFAREMLDSIKPEDLRAALSRRLGGPEEGD